MELSQKFHIQVTYSEIKEIFSVFVYATIGDCEHSSVELPKLYVSLFPSFDTMFRCTTELIYILSYGKSYVVTIAPENNWCENI